MAAPTFFGAGAGAAVSTGNVTPALPASTLANDVGIMQVMTNKGNTFPDLTSVGWTSFGTWINDANQSTAWYWRRFTGSGDAPGSFTIAGGTALGSANGLYARIYVYRGCRTTGDPFEGVANAGVPTSDTTPLTSDVTTLANDRLIVSLISLDSNVTWSSGHPPAGWADNGAIFSSTTGGNVSLDDMSITQASAGTVSAVTIGTLSAAAYWRSLTLALKPTGADIFTVGSTVTATGSITADATVVPSGPTIWTADSTVIATGSITATAQVVVPGGAPSADATGLPHQEHLFYAANSGRWWLVAIDQNSTNTLRYSWSTDLTSWTDAGTITLANDLKNVSVQSDGIGTNLSVSYKNIASTDVVHIATSYKLTTSDHRHYHLRATISGTTWTVTNTEAQVYQSTFTYDYNGDGNAVTLDSAGLPVVATGFSEGASALANMTAGRATNTDAGTSWTAGFGTVVKIGANVGTTIKSRALFDLGAGTVLYLCDNGASNGAAQTGLQWSKWNGTNWTAGGTPPDRADVGFAAGSFDYRDWGAVARTTTDVHVVKRTGTNTYEHRRFNGTSWAAGQAITTQTSKAGGGIFLASDGTDVWLFIIDSDAANTIRYVKWSGGSWGTWTALVSSTQVRTALSGCRTIGGSSFGICWTEVAGSAFRVVTAPLTITTVAIADATITATGSITADSLVVAIAGSTVTATGSITADATVVPAGPTIWTADSTVTATGSIVANATVSVGGVSSFQGLWNIPFSELLSASVSATGSISASALVIAIAAASVTATGSIAASAEVVTAGVVTADSSITATGSIAADATVFKFGAATIAATGAITATAEHYAIGGATVTATGSISASATVVTPGVQVADSSVVATGSIAASAMVVRMGAATITATGGISAAAIQTQLAVATITATGGITAAGTIPTVVMASATITATSGIVGAARQIQLAVATITAVSGVVGAPVQIQLATATITAAGVIAADGTKIALVVFAKGSTVQTGTTGHGEMRKGSHGTVVVKSVKGEVNPK